MYWLGRYLDPVTLTYILRSSAFYTFYDNVQYLLNYKAYHHQTLHSASPQYKDSAGTLTGWPWPIFHAPFDFYTFYVALPYVLNCKAFNHQTLYSTSSQCTDSTGTLTWWPWPILCTPVTLTHFMLMVGISSNIRPTTTKPCIVLHLIALAWQVPWPRDLDLYLTHFTLMFDNSSTIRPTTTIPCIVRLLDVLN